MSPIWNSGKSTPFGYRDVEPNALCEGSSDPAVRLIDVREPAEYSGELGHIPNAELVPLGTLEAASATWDKSQELIVVCRSGARSGRGAAELSKLGFLHVMNLRGGMLAWNDARYPTSR